MATTVRRKLVIVGDGACGKTCLLIVFSRCGLYVTSMWPSWLYCYHWSSGMSFPRSMCRQSLKTMSPTSRLLFSFSADALVTLTTLKILFITYDDGLVIDHGRGRMDDDGDNGQVDGIKVELEMWDTAGQEDYDRNQTSSIITITNTITTSILIITTIITTTIIIGCDRCPTRTPTWSYSASPSTLLTLLRTSQTAGRRNSNIFVRRQSQWSVPYFFYYHHNIFSWTQTELCRCL